MLILTKDKEFVARPITSLLLTMLGKPMLLGKPMKQTLLSRNHPPELICAGDVPQW